MSTLEFYLDRIASFDAERRLINHYEKFISPSRAETHALAWDTRKQDEAAASKEVDIAKLDREMTKLRSEVTAAKEKLAALKSSQNKRLDQIKRLQELRQPVMRDTTYLVPDRHVWRSDHESEKKVAASVAPVVSKRVIRTGEIVQLEIKLEEETKRVHSERFEFELAARDSYDAIARQQPPGEAAYFRKVAEAETLVRTITRLDRECFLNVSELLGLRLKILTAQRDEMDELERLQRDRDFFVAKETQTTASLKLEMDLMEKRLKAELELDTAELQQQLKSLCNQIEVLKTREVRSKHLDVAMNDKIAKLKDSVNSSRDRYENLRRRHSLEMEGYENETAMLKARLTQMAKRYNNPYAQDIHGP